MNEVGRIAVVVGIQHSILHQKTYHAVIETGYQGFVGQEFVSAGPDPLASLEKCVRICDVYRETGGGDK